MTEWRQVTISPYRSYEVSSEGEVRRGGRNPLKGYVDRYGYKTVLLYYAGLAKRFKVHRLVCEAFTGPCPEGLECAHLDGNALNNASANLAWISHRENNAHKQRHGTHQAGEKHPRARLTEDQIVKIRASSLASRALAKIYGVNQAQIVRIKNGTRWTL